MSIPGGRAGGRAGKGECVLLLTPPHSFLFVGTAILSFILHRRIHSIRTFHVEEDEDGTQLYYTQHVPATIMREESMQSYTAVPTDARRSVDLNGLRPLSLQPGAL